MYKVQEVTCYICHKSVYMEAVPNPAEYVCDTCKANYELFEYSVSCSPGKALTPEERIEILEKKVAALAKANK